MASIHPTDPSLTTSGDHDNGSVTDASTANGAVAIGEDHTLAPASDSDKIPARAVNCLSADHHEASPGKGAGATPPADEALPAYTPPGVKNLHAHRLSNPRAVDGPAQDSAGTRLEDLKTEVKAQFAKEFAALKSVIHHLDQSVLDAMRDAIDSSSTPEAVEDFRSLSLRSQIVAHADSFARKLGAGEHSAGEDLLVVADSISTLKPDLARKHCVEALKSHFGFSSLGAKRFLADRRTCHGDSPLMLRRELEEIASAHLAPATGKYASQSKALRELLDERQATRMLLRESGGDGKLIEAAMWAAHPKDLAKLRTLCLDAPNMEWLAEHAAKRTSSRSAVLGALGDDRGDFHCKNLLVTRFGMDAADATKLLKDPDTPHSKQPRMLQQELLEIARLTNGGRRLPLTKNYGLVQGMLRGRQSARELLIKAGHPEPEEALGKFVSMKRLQSFTLADAIRLAKAANRQPQISDVYARILDADSQPANHEEDAKIAEPGPQVKGNQRAKVTSPASTDQFATTADLDGELELPDEVEEEEFDPGDDVEELYERFTDIGGKEFVAVAQDEYDDWDVTINPDTSGKHATGDGTTTDTLDTALGEEIGELPDPPADRVAPSGEEGAGQIDAQPTLAEGELSRMDDLDAV